MSQDVTFGAIVRERRHLLGLTQAELGRRVGCAAITIRKIEANALQPSVQIAERLAETLGIPEEEHLAFVRLARTEREPSPIPTPEPIPAEIGQEDLSGRAIRGFQMANRIGTGGYGVVYRATQSTVGREVAVKIILPQYANQPEFIRRFEAEAQLVARLEHPHIVPLYDYWREPNVAYLIMRLLRGGNLEMRIKNGPLSDELTLSLMEQICAALHTAHRANVVHRDIKPANILLDDDGNAYLADFGIAKITGNGSPVDVTMEGTVIGSPAYISPEQILAEPVKPQADIYSMGVMLYEMLSGQKPFRGPTPIAFIQQHLNDSLPLLPKDGNGHKTSAPPTPTALDIVIGRATAKNPRNRYPNILSMLADMRRAMTPGSTAADLVDGPTTHTTPPHVTAMLELPNMENPYKGLRAFTEADTADFFGRDTLVQDLLARIGETSDLARFLAVVGPSGSGKSSVVRAGLIPALRQGGLPNSNNWFVTEMIPGAHPFEKLESALMRIAVNQPVGANGHSPLQDMLSQDERGLLRAVSRILPADESVELLLVIDQFEEVFTLVENEKTRQHFLGSLVTAVLDPDSRLRMVITLRADFIHQPLQYVDFGDLVRQRTEFVLPLTPDELEEAITGPTKRAGLSLEPGLTNAIIREIGDQPGMLPLLQYALTELFERRKGRLLTLDAYQKSGGVLGALARRADEIYEALNEDEQHMARQLFLRLVTLGEGSEDTRRRVLRSELSSLVTGHLSLADGSTATNNRQVTNGHGQMTIDEVIAQFGRYRLLTFDHDPVTRGPTVEVAHEALLREWERLRGWLAENRTDIRLQRLLASAAAEWELANQDPGYLLRDSRLDQFEGWAAGTAIALTYEERKYLRTSLNLRRARRTEEKARQKQELETAKKLADTEKRSAQRLRWLVAGLAIFLVAAVGLAIFAFNQQNIAHSNFVTAERIRLAAQAQIALDNGEGGDLPALLALRSLQQGYSPEADAALLNALKRGFARQQYLGHTDTIAQVDFSNDGRTMLTAGYDRTVRLWDVQTGQEIRQFVGHTGPVNAAIFSPDNSQILTDGLDGTIRLWDTQTGQEIRQFIGETVDMWGIDFSPDGRYVVAGDGKVARLWDTQTGQEIRQFIGHTDILQWTEISPDGRYLATVSKDKTARLWDIATGDEIRQFTGHTDAVTGGRFSADGQYLLTSSFDRTARLWDIQTGLEIRRFVGHTDFIFDAVFSPDGRYVVTGSNDKTARLWDIQTGQEVRQFIGHTGGVGPPTFSPNGQYVLTGSTDRTARLWEVWQETEPRRLHKEFIAHTAGLYAMSLSPDDQFLLTGDGANTVRLWDLQKNQVSQEIKLETANVNTQAFSQDNQLVLVGQDNGLVRLWALDSGKEIRQFEGHTGPVLDVNFAPDGRTILTGGEDNTARLWNTETGQELRQFAKHSGPVHNVAFSPDGQTIVTGSADNTTRLWNAETGQTLQQFNGHSEPVLAVAFSPDGRTILTGSEDDTARLWDVETGQEVRRFIGHTDQVTRVAFSPDSRFVLTGSADQTARLWNVETGQLVRQFSGHNSSVLTVDFSTDGRTILTGDNLSAYLWRTSLDDIIAFTCTQLSRDFTAEERTLYNITNIAPTCTNFAEQSAIPEPTWTPVPPSEAPITSLDLKPVGQPSQLVAEMEFMNDMASVQMEMPMQDVYLDVGDGQVMRPTVVNAETLAQPLYRAASEVEPDLFELPWDLGPYPKGEPLGFTLADWVAAKGQGTYTVKGNRATIDLTFDNLIPNGTYTVWCVIWNFQKVVSEVPCGAQDGSENSFITDAGGHGETKIEIAPFAPSLEEAINGIAIAYHSDGTTWGDRVGPHGLEAHVQMWYDFMPGEFMPTASAQPAPSAIDLTVELEFINESANIQMGAPIQDVFVDAGNEQVVRVDILNEETRALPVYRTAVEAKLDLFEAPFDVGPFPKGEPLGFTLGDYVSVTGRGTYKVQGERAIVDLSFEHLVPGGIYTMWCVVLSFKNATMQELPCLSPDGVEYGFTADEAGHGEIKMDIEAFPPSTEDAIHEIAVAYHSDGQTHGSSIGAHGMNAHGLMFYDFMPPEAQAN